MKAKAQKILAIKPNRKSPPGTRENPVIFDGEVACRSELLSNNNHYSAGAHVLVNRGVYLITSLPQTSNDGYAFCYRCKPVGMI